MSRGWNPEWGEQPAEPERPEAQFGPPAYTFPPYIAKLTRILNGCPRCSGSVIFRHRDKAVWCPKCDRGFFPMSEDSVIRAPDKPAEGR